MKKNIVVVAVLLIAVLFACVGCQPEAKLKGTFVNADGDSMYFDGDGTVTMTAAEFPISISGTYTVSGSTVTIIVMGTAATATWSGNTITDPNGVVWTKK